MPAGDRTGPMGAGPRTGRAAGYCGGFGMPGYANPVPGRGFGMGFGRGRGFWRRPFGGRFGWRNRFFATGMPAWMPRGPYLEPEPEAEKQGLKQQAEALEAELDMVRKRLDALESENTS